MTPDGCLFVRSALRIDISPMLAAVPRPRIQQGTRAAFGVYVVVLAAAYYYNLTLVQLGVTDTGMQRLGLAMEVVAGAMGLLAVVTLAVTLLSGTLIDRWGWGLRTVVKCRVLFGIVVLQIGVTALLPAVASLPGFLLWIMACAVLLGAAIPVAFSLMLDLVAPGMRGYAAGAVTGCAFALAVLVPYEWAVGNFVPAAIAVLTPAAVALGAAAGAPRLVDGLDPGDRTGRGARGADRTSERTRDQSWAVTAPLVGGVLLLFGAFFIDSLGFVRIIEQAQYVETSWQSSAITVRGTLAVTHVVGGLAAGVVYTKGRLLWVFMTAFALFGLAQCLYVYDIVVGGPSVLTTVIPLVYILAVSSYTTVAFALWPDLATPGTIGRYTAVGIGVGAWTATFSSTALALVSELVQLRIAWHLGVVAGLSAGFLLLTVLWSPIADIGGR